MSYSQEISKVSRVSIGRDAKAALRTMAEAAGIPQRQFLELLLNYAYSIHRRPGSWEASIPFEPTIYTRPDTVADQWWTIPKSTAKEKLT